MNGQSMILMWVLLLSLSAPPATGSQDYWQPPFQANPGEPPRIDSAMGLTEILSLVAEGNPTLRALHFRIESVRHRIDQTSLYPNPELEAEIEDIGWDAPGLREPEITLRISQEFEIFGQKAARKAVARAGLRAAESEAATAAFDLYLETKQRFYALVHAQRKQQLLQDQVRLATTVVDNIEYRTGKGAGLQSELLLARLELQRIELDLAESEQDLIVAQLALTSLWEGQSRSIYVSDAEEPDLSGLLDRLDTTRYAIDSTRSLLSLSREAEVLRAERDLAAAEVRPSLTLTGGVKHLEAEGTNSFLVGVSVPLPLWNRNQGARKSLQAKHEAAELGMKRVHLQTQADIESAQIRLRLLDQRHATVDHELLPTAESVYRTLEKDYGAGRLPYTSLLEAERILLELRREHADLLLEIQKQIMALEYVTGLVLTTEPL